LLTIHPPSVTYYLKEPLHKKGTNTFDHFWSERHFLRWLSSSEIGLILKLNHHNQILPSYPMFKCLTNSIKNKLTFCTIFDFLGLHFLVNFMMSLLSFGTLLSELSTHIFILFTGPSFFKLYIIKIWAHFIRLYKAIWWSI